MSDIIDAAADEYLVRPDPADSRLTERVTGVDQSGASITTSVTVERPLTIFLNAQEIVTAMTIADNFAMNLPQPAYDAGTPAPWEPVMGRISEPDRPRALPLASARPWLSSGTRW